MPELDICMQGAKMRGKLSPVDHDLAKMLRKAFSLDKASSFAEPPAQAPPPPRPPMLAIQGASASHTESHYDPFSGARATVDPIKTPTEPGTGSMLAGAAWVFKPQVNFCGAYAPKPAPASSDTPATTAAGAAPCRCVSVDASGRPLRRCRCKMPPMVAATVAPGPAAPAPGPAAPKPGPEAHKPGGQSVHDLVNSLVAGRSPAKTAKAEAAAKENRSQGCERGCQRGCQRGC